MFSFPVLMSQTLSVLSLLPLTSSLLSADHATWYTDPTWPRRDIRYLWEWTIRQRHNYSVTHTQILCLQHHHLDNSSITQIHSWWEIFLLSSASVPDFNGLVEWGRGEEPGVWGEEHFVDQSAVAGHPGQRLLVFCRVPQEQGEIIWARHQALWSWTLQHHNRSKGTDIKDLQTWTHQYRQTNRTYPNFIISLQSLLLQLFHWGKEKCLKS